VRSRQISSHNVRDRYFSFLLSCDDFYLHERSILWHKKILQLVQKHKWSKNASIWSFCVHFHVTLWIRSVQISSGNKKISQSIVTMPLNPKKFFSDRFQILQNLSKRYPNFYSLWFGTKYLFVTDDPKIAQKLLTTPQCVEKNFFMELFGFSNGLISLKCKWKKWKFLRS
jgi:hypothetical protein